MKSPAKQLSCNMNAPQTAFASYRIEEVFMVKIIERITYRDDDTLENTDRKIEIPGRVVGSQMVAGVLNIMGWHLVMIDREHLTSVQIDGENENDLLELKRLLEKTTMKISIQVNLNLPDF